MSESLIARRELPLRFPSKWGLLASSALNESTTEAREKAARTLVELVHEAWREQP